MAALNVAESSLSSRLKLLFRIALRVSPIAQNQTCPLVCALILAGSRPERFSVHNSRTL
jgi:hypothetical protein